MKRMVVEGVHGDVEIVHSDSGARATAGGRLICDLHRTDDADTRWAAAGIAATKIGGTDRRGRPLATEAVIHEVLQALKRVAGERS